MRPKLISVLCSVFGALQFLTLFGSIQALLITLGIVEFELSYETEELAVISDSVANLTVTAAVFGFLSNVLVFASLVGLWRLKRWGVYLYLCLILTGLFVTYVIDPPWALENTKAWWLPFIMPAIYLAVVLPYWGRLDSDVA